MNLDQVSPPLAVQPQERSGWSPRTAGYVGGGALALMAVFSAFGVFGAIAPLITAGDADATAASILESELLFRAGIASMVVVVILDIVAAGALYWVFALVHREVAALATWFRLAYAAVFMVAIVQLSVAVTLLDQPEMAMNAIEAFYGIWQIGLILFGCDLVLYGYLAWKSGFMARVFGILLVIAGLGYAVDGFGVVLVPGFTPTFAAVTFVGEVALFLWLLIRGKKLPR